MPPSKRGTADAAKLRAEIALRRAQAELEHLHLEIERGNSAATRNTRRAALRSFFTYASYRAPGAIATISQDA